MKGFCLSAACLCLAGCSNAAAPETPAQTSAPTATHAGTENISDSPDTLDSSVSFEDILAQYQALNQRLEEVAYRVQIANAALCPVTKRSVGMEVHTLSDYPEDLQPVAQALLGVGPGLSLRTVRAGSPAQRAGFMPGDRLRSFGGAFLPSGQTAQTFFQAVSQQALAKTSLEISVVREEQTLTRTLKPETICGYPAILVFSEQINGHTDGQEVFITSELMRSLPADSDLALIVAHEMAHAIAGHMQKPPSKALELEADRMALIMLARAGFDYAKAVENWAASPQPDDGERPSTTHPGRAERLAHFKDVGRDIFRRLEKGYALNFD